MMRCDNCGGKHRRIFIDRPWYSARFCKRCNVRHSAKEVSVNHIVAIINDCMAI